jgi:glucose/arabinose dehydrogenase
MRLLLLLLLFIACNGHRDNSPAIKKDSVVTGKVPDTVIIGLADTSVYDLNTATQPVRLKPVPVNLSNGKKFDLNIPEGYNLSIAAEGLKRLRFLAMSPDNRLFATDMYNRDDNHKGRVLIFEDWNDSLKQFGKVTTYLDSLYNPNQVAFYRDFIYVAETGRLKRYTYHAGDTMPADTGRLIATFPAHGLSYKYGGWHLTRSIAFHHDKLYVSVGSSCNACIEKEAVRACILEMDPDGSGLQIFARGLRNSVGIKWIGNDLWGTGMGRDLIGPDKPEDPFQKIERNGYYGWPFYYQYQNKIFEDVQFKDSAKASWVKEPPVGFLGFKAHSAPLGFEYFRGFDDPVLKNSILVCLHGSTSVWRERGNSVVKIEAKNKYTEIISGFLSGKTEADRHGRPCDILMKDTRSFFITDDLNGVLYYVWK